jgi:hypothetical protein
MAHFYIRMAHFYIRMLHFYIRMTHFYIKIKRKYTGMGAVYAKADSKREKAPLTHNLAQISALKCLTSAYIMHTMANVQSYKHCTLIEFFGGRR